jgi:hypothetical protein
MVMRQRGTDLGDWGVRLLRESRMALLGTPWVELLESPAAAGKLPQFDEFRDEAGHRREIDRYLLAHLVGVSPQSPPADAGTDVALWARIASGSRDFFWTEIDTKRPWLVRERDDLTIETWTQAELCCLHALSHAGPTLKPRADAAADWMIEHLQPDNATNHPWAIHMFLRRAAEIGSDEHRLYAEALLHNAVISLGRADRFSALILLDSGRWLQRQPEVRSGSAC